MGVLVSGALLTSCTTTYDRAGRPQTSVSPQGAALGAAAAGLIAYHAGRKREERRDRRRDRERAYRNYRYNNTGYENSGYRGDRGYGYRRDRGYGYGRGY